MVAFFVCGVAIAHTIRWHVGDNVYTTTTCNSGDSITPPTAPAGKTGYHFVGWEPHQRIKYLESNGTQYINTKQSLLYGYRYVAKVEYTDLTDYSDRGSLIFGTLTTNNGVLVGILDEHFLFRCITNITTGDNININKVYTFDLQLALGNNVLSIYDEAGALQDRLPINTQTTLNNLNYYLFGLNFNNVATGLSSLKLYEFKVYNADILIHYFIPVIDTNGTPCMLDNVTGQYFYNAGSGQFIAGPAI